MGHITAISMMEEGLKESLYEIVPVPNFAGTTE